MSRKAKQNICTNEELAEIIRQRLTADDPAFAALITDVLGAGFSAQWERRSRSLGQGYAALVRQVLDAGPADISPDKVWGAVQ